MEKRKLITALNGRGVTLMLLSMLTGLVVGVFVTFYNIAIEKTEHFTAGIYQTLLENPAFIPLLFLALAVAAFIVSVLIKLVPMIKGSGIPQTEGAARGIFSFSWWRVLTGMAAASLLSVLMGVSGGSEGPSLQLGGSCGLGVASVLKRNDLGRRYQITAGASAGLAVAFNAPLTGLMFAFEEAHRRFTPEIFICALSSVATGVVTRTLLLNGLGIKIDSVLDNYVLPSGSAPLAVFGFVVLAAFVTALIGVVFYKLCLLSRKLLMKVTFLKGFGKVLIPFMLAGVLGLLSTEVLGGGRSLIDALGTQGGAREMEITSFFGTSFTVSILCILAMRMLASIFNLGAGVPIGIFIPMLAFGACSGAMMAKLSMLMGMPVEYCDLITMVCMATFFVSVVKAPITAIAMVFELTWSFTALLPVIVSVAIGYMVSCVFRLEPLYEKLLTLITKEMHVSEGAKRQTVKVHVLKDSDAENKAIREIFWPCNALVLSVIRDGVRMIPTSDMVMQANDLLVMMAEVRDLDAFCNDLAGIMGEQPSRKVTPIEHQHDVMLPLAQGLKQAPPEVPDNEDDLE